MRAALIEGFSILAFMSLMAFLSIVFPQVKHDPVSPDFRIAEISR